MATKLVGGIAYSAQLHAKHLAPQHHKKAAGGYRDYTTNPIAKNEVKQYQVDRASQTIGRNEARTSNNTAPRSDQTRNNGKQDLPNNVKQNEAGTTSNMRGILIVGAVLVAAGVVYYYYR